MLNVHLSCAWPANMIQTLIFDFDGTILETELPDYLSWQETFQEHNCELPIDLWLKGVGGSEVDFDPWACLEEQLGRPVDRPTVRERQRTRLRELISQQNLRAGVQETIEAAKALGLRLGVASSSGRDWVTGYLDLFELRPYFEVIFTREDVVRVKPDPALYSKAVNALGVPPAQAVAIEDSRNGMLAAKAAGLKCLVVPNEVTQQLTFPEADLQMKSLAERPLVEWLDALQSSVSQKLNG
jgi:HAD superfamily hydrolase (TIGR01509 family)